MYDETIEMLAFNLKLMGKKSRKTVLISAGKMEDKLRMLPSIRKLSELNISVYSTIGTHRFLNDNGVENQLIHKITEKLEPNIKSFLEKDRFDLIINVLTGNFDYDESSDNNLIRTLSIENGIPLFTDVDVAILTMEQMVKKSQESVTPYKIADGTQPWNMRAEFLQLVNQLGGFACYHAHFDKAYLINLENLKLSQVDMRKKWDLYRYLKENYTHEDLVERISRCAETMIKQGVTQCRTFVDADSTAGLLPIQAALEVKERFKGRLDMELGVQPLEGVLSKEALAQFERACELADVVGGLPSKDRPLPEKHLDIVLGIAKALGKKVDVHIDQENNPYEHETELLARKTIEHGLEGRVCGIHAISLAARPEVEQDRVIQIVKDAGMGIIICPSAAISMRQLDMPSPLHNSIAPFPNLHQKGVPVFMGTDNICDLFMPLSDGDMWFECRLLMEACRFYDIETVARVACDKSGFGAGRERSAA
jgi:hypothetical protein